MFLNFYTYIKNIINKILVEELFLDTLLYGKFFQNFW